VESILKIHLGQCQIVLIWSQQVIFTEMFDEKTNSMEYVTHGIDPYNKRLGK